MFNLELGVGYNEFTVDLVHCTGKAEYNLKKRGTAAFADILFLHHRSP
jgi:hypothetical protein